MFFCQKDIFFQGWYFLSNTKLTIPFNFRLFSTRFQPAGKEGDEAVAGMTGPLIAFEAVGFAIRGIALNQAILPCKLVRALGY